MADFSIDFGGGPNLRLLLAEGGSDEPVPAGLYFAHIYDTKWGETGERAKRPGETKLIVTYKIDGGDFDGHEIERNYMFSKPARGFFTQMARAATNEISDEQLAGRADLYPEQVDKALTGARVIIEASTDQFNGRTRNDVKNVFGATSEHAERAKNFDPNATAALPLP
jgi:hypothetical protein